MDIKEYLRQEIKKNEELVKLMKLAVASESMKAAELKKKHGL